MQLVVTVKKLNKRSSPPVSFSDNNVIGTALQGFRFNGDEILDLPNQSLGKWYRDGNGSCYWGGGLVVEQGQLSIIRSVNNALIKNLPNDYCLGVDLSHHNPDPDWTAIKNAKIRFVYLKISEGVGTPDQKAKEHAQNAKKNNIKIGYYHFGHPDTKSGGTIESDATAEADEAVNIMATLPKPDLPLVLDLEDEDGWDTPLNPDGYLLWIRTFISRVKERTGADPIIYSRKGYLDSKLPNNHSVGNCKLWISNYSQTDCNLVSCPLGWETWTIWQFTEGAQLGAGNAKLDLNILKDLTIIS